MKVASLYEFDIGHFPIKVKVTTQLQIVLPFTTIQTVKSYISALAPDKKLKLIMCSSDINIQLL